MYDCKVILAMISFLGKRIRTITDELQNPELNDQQRLELSEELIAKINQRLSLLELYEENCVNAPVIYDLKASNILIELDHANLNIRVKGQIYNVYSEPAKGPIQYSLVAIKNAWFKEYGWAKDSDVLHGQIPQGTTIGQGQAFITEPLDTSLVYYDLVKNEGQQKGFMTNYTFNLVIDPNYQINDLNRSNNEVSLLHQKYYKPSIFTQSLPVITKINPLE